MKHLNAIKGGLAAGATLLAALTGTVQAAHSVHDIDGITGPNFTLAAKSGYISTAEGNSIYFWGYASNHTTAVAQYVGPTLIVTEDVPVTVVLSNGLPVNTSIVFPGHRVTSAVGGVAGALTQEAAPGGLVTYTFTPTEPGTYQYQSGTKADLQTEMGLVGALIVRPTGFDGAYDSPNRRAYATTNSVYEHEQLFVLTEMDENIHDLVEAQVQKGETITVDMTKRWPVYWFINGRTGPDTVLGPGVPWLPHQPYDSLVFIGATDKVLMRVVGAGLDSHPFHHHGNHAQIIARDGRLLRSSATATTSDLAQSVFTIPSSPGSTYDAIFEWTGEKLGWDAYGHLPDDINVGSPNFPIVAEGDVDHNGNGVFDTTPLAVGEYAPDHGKPFPVKLPSDQDLTFGQFYSGSPFLGVSGALPPGEGGFNPVGGFMYMWHSHAEKELCNNNIFGGGMLTFVIIAAHHAD